MIMTVVEAHVDEEHWAELQDDYARRSQGLAPGIVQSMLVHSMFDPTLWQILTIWTSVEAARAMGQPGEARPADLMFRAAGAEPTHTVLTIVLQARND